MPNSNSSEDISYNAHNTIIIHISQSTRDCLKTATMEYLLAHISAYQFRDRKGLNGEFEVEIPRFEGNKADAVIAKYIDT